MEKTKNFENYSIGIDIGTNSVGWAVMNDDYSLVRKDHKNLWGVNLFDEGQSAQDRRAKRTARRRLERRKQRIRSLRELMSKDILKVDPSFYIRMDESFLHRNDDFGRKSKYNLFEDKLYTDKEFYEEYPSIYHLRRDLITNDKKFDIRLIYLALHHIIKYRGNFLYEGDVKSFKGYDTQYIESYFSELENFSIDNSIYIDNIKNIENILFDTTIKRKEKVEKIKSLFADKTEQAFISQFANAILGMKFELGTVCCQDDIKNDAGKILKISFTDSDYEEKVSGYTDLAGDGASLLGALYTLYFALAFKEILGNNEYLSSAMCDKYDIHHKDLYEIKGMMKEYCDEKSYAIFFTSKVNKAKDEICYYNYIHRPKILTNKIKNKTANEIIINKIFELLEKTGKKDALHSDERYIALKNIKDNEIREILPRLNSKINASIPYQMNCKELEVILENQGKYYPSLKETKDKIISLLSFRRPYYVGVLNTNSPFNWYKKPIDGKVEPWNFEDKIDPEYAQEQFINTLTNYCSIFPEEKVLPQNSFLYSEYMVLDELNKIKVKDKLIAPSVKKQMFTDLFCSENAKAKVTKKDIIDWFSKNQNISYLSEDISGLHEGDSLSNIYKPYRDFKRILSESFDEKDIPLYEKVVSDLTIFTDTNTRIDRIEKTLEKGKNNITDKQIKALAKLNYKGWGRFSKKLLNGIYSKEENRRTIIQVMRDTNFNFMEITATKDEKDKFGFKAQMQPPKKDIANFYEDCILPSYCSPAVKKATNQAVKIIDEIIKIMGYAPTTIYIESASGEDLNKKGSPQKSRSSILQGLYKNVKDVQDEDYKHTLEELNEKIDKEKKNGVKSIESEFNDEKLYLYFTQLGKCMYSGESLDINKLPSYEIDHIIPQSLVKDNSRDNKVLVKKIENQNKSDNLTLSSDIIKARMTLWTKLLKMKFISKKKFNSLTRERFDDKDVEGFINRQLVETRQTVKEVSNIIKMLPQLESCDVVKVSARACDDLKSSFGYFKVRNLNDYHHVKDAYITAVLGRFTQKTVAVNNGDFRKEYIKDIWASTRKGGLSKTQKLRGGIVCNMMNLKYDSMLHTANTEFDENGELVQQELQMISSEGEIIWSSSYRRTVLKTLNYNDCMLTKKVEQQANSDFYDQTIYGKNSSKANLISRKTAIDKLGNKVDLPPEEYGGYSSISSAYSMAIEYKNKKKIERKIINIPLINVYKDNVDEYLKKQYGEYKVLKDKIYRNQMLLYKGQLCYFVSDSELNNATQIKAKQYWQEALCKIAKASEKKTALSQANMTDEEYAKINKQIRTFVDDYILQLSSPYFALYNDIAKNIKCYVDKGGFDTLSFEQKQSFVLELLKITSTAGRTDKLKEYKVTINGEDLFVKGSSLGRLAITLNLDDIVFVNRSITGFWEKKIHACNLGKEKK